MRGAILPLFLLAACSSETPGRDAGWIPLPEFGARDRGAGDRGATDLRGSEPGAPAVGFVSPQDGATLPNPVLFTIWAKGGIEEVELFADQTYSLGAAFDPAKRQTLLYRFSGTGVPRALRVAGRIAGQEVASAAITITVTPDSCEDRFFVAKFDASNKDPSGTLDLVGIREDALKSVRDAVAGLQACGAKVTLGAMLSLLYYEGAFRVAHFNTICEENSYNKTATDCDLVAEALYSYQLGLGAMHTSNFHPCKDVGYTSTMRQRFLQQASAAGFSTASSLMTSALTARFKTVCPNATPSAVDYYILGAHEVFAIPKDASGNHLQGYGKHPLFTPAVSVGLSLSELAASCASIGDDRKAITVFGGGDASYGTSSKQDAILSLYQSFETSSCK